MAMNIIVLYCLFHIITKQNIFDIRFCCFTCKLHHHSSRRVSIHVGILSGNIRWFSLYDLLKCFSGRCFSGNISIISTRLICFPNILESMFSELLFNSLMNIIHIHRNNIFFGIFDCLRYDAWYSTIFFRSYTSRFECIFNRISNFSFVELNDSSVSFYNLFNHSCVF